jgi:hypothetical protein
MYLHAVIFQVECDVSGMEMIICKILFDYMRFIATTDDKLINPVGGIDLHNMPKDRLSSDLYHRLGFNAAFLADTRSKSSSQNYCLHRTTPLSFPVIWSYIG